MPFDLLKTWGDWVWFAGAALGITTILAALAYMLAELLMSDKMKSWAKMELVEIFYSAVIISLAIFALPIMDGVVQGSLMVSNFGMGGGTPGCGGTVTSTYVPMADYGFIRTQQKYDCVDICGAKIAERNDSAYHGIDSCHMRLGIWYMREVFDETKQFAYDTYVSYIETAMIAEFAINIEFVFEAAGFFTFTPWKGFFTIGNAVKSMAFDWAIKIMMLTKFQEVFLSFIAKALFPALFIIGALLRTFVFTRRLGGLLLAMAITLYFIFPSFYAFAALIMLDIKNDPLVQAQWYGSPANPHHLPDPPIAKVMYFPGNATTIHGIGGSGSSAQYTLQDAQDKLMELEMEDSKQNMQEIEECSGGVMPKFDLSSRQFNALSDGEKNSTMVKLWGMAESWLGTMSKVNKLDKFLDIAWRPGGYLDSLARLAFWAAFFSFISVIGCIAAIRSLAMTFGGDIEIAGLTRLI